MPGKGYWVRTTSNGEITVQTMDGFASVSTPNDELIGNSNKITFTNSKGHSTQLNFGIIVPEEEIIFYSLPPTPPAGGFDIRFDDDLRLGDVGSEIFIQNSHWPLKVEIQNNNGLVLRDEENGKEYSFGENGFVTITEPTDRLTLAKGTLVPNTFALHQNYPNPFNPVTTISYDLPEVSNVKLSVFDINGRFVETLVIGRVAAGKHSVEWDSKNSPSGIYIYRLTFHQKQITKKMVLLK
tara:strand:+ start:14185 stop:14901 length:717 start_codon:yes stop_codon:yes gene_type:complete